MRVYVSSTFEDLREFRNAANRILRQLGHEVVAMEDYVAASTVPLEKVLDDVKSCDVYVGLFAWRYGFVPVSGPVLQGATPGKTSITEYEYLQAKQAGLSILAFLLDERAAWPPHSIDGFESETDGSQIRDLRTRLQQERIVSYFNTPEDLEARVSAAVTTEGMTRQVRLNLIQPANPILLQAVASEMVVPDSSYANEIWDAIVNARDRRVVTIDIATEWWSTRLYLLAALAEQLTQIRRILIVENAEFVGLISTSAILTSLEPNHSELRRFHMQLGRRYRRESDVAAEARAIVDLWKTIFFKKQEKDIKDTVTSANLRRWLGDALLRQPIRIADLGQASILDLARLMDYPSDFVPVVGERSESDATREWATPIVVVDKEALNGQLARTYVGEMLDRLGFQ